MKKNEHRDTTEQKRAYVAPRIERRRTLERAVLFSGTSAVSTLSTVASVSTAGPGLTTGAAGD